MSPIQPDVYDLPADVLSTLWRLLTVADGRHGIADDDKDLLCDTTGEDEALAVALSVVLRLGLVQAKTQDDPGFASLFDANQLAPSLTGREVMAALDDLVPCCELHDEHCGLVDEAPCGDHAVRRCGLPGCVYCCACCPSRMRGVPRGERS